MTFTFTMDAFPDYTKFDKTKKVLAAIQVISDEEDDTDATREPCTESTSSDDDTTTTDDTDAGE